MITSLSLFWLINGTVKQRSKACCDIQERMVSERWYWDWSIHSWIHWQCLHLQLRQCYVAGASSPAGGLHHYRRSSDVHESWLSQWIAYDLSDCSQASHFQPQRTQHRCFHFQYSDRLHSWSVWRNLGYDHSFISLAASARLEPDNFSNQSGQKKIYLGKAV